MINRVLAQRVLLVSLVAGASYMLPVLAQWQGPVIIAWKGLGVGFLALYAALSSGHRDVRQIALAMALGAAGDVVLDIAFAVGAALFALGHLVAIHMYWRNRSAGRGAADQLIALGLLLGVPMLAFLISHRPDVAGYAAVLGAMAATAWRSNFLRGHVALGALLFAVSDLLIFARMGPLSGSALPHLLVWPLYYAGQALIATGVVRARA